MYTGKRCHRGLILVPEVGELKFGAIFDLKITTALPDNALTVKLSCGGGGGIFPQPCDLTFSNQTPTTASTKLLAAISGIQYLTFKLEGPNAMNYDVPPPLAVFVYNEGSSFYFSKFSRPFVHSSCCQPSLPMPLLRCSMNPRFGVQFTSSCHWDKDGSTLKTKGIVFSSYNNMLLPVSVAGLKVTVRSGSSVDVEVPATASVNTCGNCNNQLINLKSSTDRCYQYRPKPEDLREFVSEQSLTKTFINEVTSKLLPNWINLTVSVDGHAIRRLVEADYRVSIATESKVIQLPGCESVILDRRGQFSVLLHNGALDVDLQTSSSDYEQIMLSFPNRGSFYCLVVDLCSGDRSPVYIGIPSTSQRDLQTINFLNEYIKRGWSFSLLSLIIHYYPYAVNTEYQFWNGLTHDYIAPVLMANIKANVKSNGFFVYQTTNVSFSFSGNLSYNYMIGSNEVYIYSVFIALINIP